MAAVKDRIRPFVHVSILALMTSAAYAQSAPIVQPGAPGADTRQLSAEEAVKIADTRYSADDVRFMQDMIPHHNQAVQMADLVEARTNNAEISDLAGRIDASQADEIEFMQNWLRERGETVPEPSAHHAMHMAHEMAGMATPEQMKQLAGSEGAAFDTLFLTLMIAHHEGAVEMVDHLLQQPGSAYDPVLYDFVSDIKNDQRAEIERMNALLVSLSPDPRANLAPGFDDAGQAIMNMELVAALPKPPGFFDPNNPAELPPVIPQEEDENGQEGEMVIKAMMRHNGVSALPY